MSRFVKRSSARFELGDGDWVELLEQMGYGDRQKVERKLFRLVIGKPPAPTDQPAEPKLGDASAVDEDLELDTAAANLELLRICVLAWGGPGFCGAAAHPHEGNCVPMPITVENLAQLDETGEKILLELQRRMVKPKADFSPSPSPDTSSGAAAAPTEEGSAS